MLTLKIQEMVKRFSHEFKQKALDYVPVCKCLDVRTWGIMLSENAKPTA